MNVFHFALAMFHDIIWGTFAFFVSLHTEATSEDSSAVNLRQQGEYQIPEWNIIAALTSRISAGRSACSQQLYSVVCYADVCLIRVSVSPVSGIFMMMVVDNNNRLMYTGSLDMHHSYACGHYANHHLQIYVRLSIYILSPHVYI